MRIPVPSTGADVIAIRSEAGIATPAAPAADFEGIAVSGVVSAVSAVGCGGLAGHSVAAEVGGTPASAPCSGVRTRRLVGVPSRPVRAAGQVASGRSAALRAAAFLT